MIMPETTPTFVCLVGQKYTTGLSNCRIDIQQGSFLIQKYFVDSSVVINPDMGTIMVTLTQEETSHFNVREKLRVQIHGLMADGTAWKTCISNYKIGETITNDILTPIE